MQGLASSLFYRSPPSPLIETHFLKFGNTESFLVSFQFPFSTIENSSSPRDERRRERKKEEIYRKVFVAVVVVGGCNDPKDLRFATANISRRIELSRRRREITVESVSRRYTVVSRQGLRRNRVALHRSFAADVSVAGRGGVGAGNGAGSCCNSSPRTRPDRHLRRLSRRRLTNWLLNYWAT